MPEGTEVIEPVVTPPVEEVPRETPPAESEKPKEPIIDEEPGGKGPLEVARRKEYERRVAAEARATALEEQLRTARETPSETPKIYSAQEIEDAITAGTLSRADGTSYLVRIEVQRAQVEERQRAAALKPLERAQGEFDEYLNLSPDLLDVASDARRKADLEVERLIRDYGQPRNVVTKRQALENVLGKLSDLKARKQMNDDTRREARPAPSDAGAGGGTVGNGAGILSKATASQVAAWNRDGLSEKQRIEEMKIYNNLKQSGRFG